MQQLARLAPRQRSLLQSAGRHLRHCSAAPEAGAAGAEGGASSVSSAPLSAQAKRTSVSAPSGGVQLGKFQRGGLGVVGAGLATAGTGGLAWLHWPLMGPSGACAAAGMAGMALVAVAAKGKLPAGKGDAKVPAEQKFELKLLNDDARFKGDEKALKLLKLGTGQQLPSGLETALMEAEKSATEAKKAQETKQAADLVEEVKNELKAGASAAELRQRLRPRAFVFDYNTGQDMRPKVVHKQLELLSTTVSFIVANASKFDEAVLRLTSPGGAVTHFGLAASQLQRIRDAGIRLVVCVDTVAASGGYMMACVADEIVSAPFAMVGSIGVILGIPNVSKVLDKYDVEFKQLTAGRYKSNLNVLTPNTEEGVAKAREDMELIHLAFQQHIKNFRPSLDVEEVATGEVWLGSSAVERGLVDRIGTSDAYISGKVADGFDAIQLLRPEKKKQGLAKLLEGFGGKEAAESMGAQCAEFTSSVWARLCRGGASASVPRAEAIHLHDRC